MMNSTIITKKTTSLLIILIDKTKTIVTINNRDLTIAEEITVRDIINKMKTNKGLSFKTAHTSNPMTLMCHFSLITKKSRTSRWNKI